METVNIPGGAFVERCLDYIHVMAKWPNFRLLFVILNTPARGNWKVQCSRVISNFVRIILGAFGSLAISADHEGDIEA